MGSEMCIRDSTGPGGKYEPAGVVHKGEYVINQDSTKKIMAQAPGLLSMLNGYASGGFVSRMSASAQVAAPVSTTEGPRNVINMQTNDPVTAARRVYDELEWRAVNG